MATCIQKLMIIEYIIDATNYFATSFLPMLLATFERGNTAHLPCPEVTLMTYQIWTYLSAGSFKGYFEQAKWVGTAAGET